MRRSPLATAILYLAAGVVALFSVFPFLWMFLTSLKQTPEILRADPVFWPSDPAWGRYVDVLEAGFLRFLLNSVVVATTTTVLTVLVAAMAAYALARFRLPLRRYLLVLVLSVQMFPLVVLIIPLFAVMRRLDLLNSYVGLILAYLSFTVPLSVWILRGFILGIPEEIEEAALTDGATRIGAIRHVVLPMAAPGLAATGIFSFIAAWNEFLFALTFIKQQSMRTLPVALQSFIGRAQTDWGGIMAASVLFTVPVVIFFLAVHRRLVEGFVAGSVKG